MKSTIGNMIEKRNAKVKATAGQNKEELAKEQSEVKKTQPKETAKSQQPAVVDHSDKSTLGI